jgi:uncharacterized protein YprB with RNaseH-like and TPR domain
MDDYVIEDDYLIEIDDYEEATVTMKLNGKKYDVPFIEFVEMLHYYGL